YACASVDFADSTSSGISVTIPPQIRKRLAADTTTESFQTFVRICGERRGMHLALFPVEFLPNLRKDSAFFALPYYSMLKAVSEYYAGNIASCRNEIRSVFRSCFARDLLGRFDSLRLATVWKQTGVSTEALALLHEAQDLERANNPSGAGDKFREAAGLTPGFALASFALGEFYARTADSVRAITSFQQAYQADTLYLTAYLRCSELFAHTGDFRSAIDVLTLALARGNDFWITNFSMGQAFVGSKDPLSAQARFARALELNPRSYETYIAAGKAFQASKDFHKARDYFNRAIEIDALRREAVDALNALNEQVLNVR
ncbi:MAG TPA: tetratricopeptide repeat protein, partial [Bacteroidota bacterium]|nr:tetratricopeptide repeat protein [Bacteroidota bacterium]